MRSTILAGLMAAFAVPASAHESAAPTSQRSSPPTAARGAAAVVDGFHAALKRGDTRAAASLLGDDALIFESGGVERSKAEYAAHHLPADADFSKAVRSTITRRAGYSGGTLAWIATEGRMRGAYRGKAVDQMTTESMVLRRVGGAWKIVHIHWSSAAAREGS